MRLARLLVLFGLVVGLAAAAEAPARTLYLIRHGHYDLVKDADPKTALGLNELGREQAGLVAARLAALPVKFSAVTSSEFTRARETSDTIAAALGQPCRREALLNECMPPGVDVEAAKVDAGAEAQLEAAWKKFAVPPTGERVNELLVCHGNVIRWLVCRALGTDTRLWTRMGIANCSITIIRILPDGTARLIGFNDAAHLPAEKKP